MILAIKLRSAADAGEKPSWVCFAYCWVTGQLAGTGEAPLMALAFVGWPALIAMPTKSFGHNSKRPPARLLPALIQASIVLSFLAAAW